MSRSKQLEHYLQTQYLKLSLKALPVVLLLMCFLLSIRLFKMGDGFHPKMALYVTSVFLFEIFPWLISIIMYVYLLWLNNRGEVTLIKNFRSTWVLWKSLWPLWIGFCLVMMIYTGFIAPHVKYELRSQNPLEGLPLNKAVKLHDGALWLNEKDSGLALNWWYQNTRQETSLAVDQIKLQGKAIQLDHGTFHVSNGYQGIDLSFESGLMNVTTPLKGTKYMDIKSCLKALHWGEVGFRLNSMILVILGSMFMFLLYEWLTFKSMYLFVGITLLLYLPLWSYVKDHRESIGFFMALLPSYAFALLNFILALRLRGQLK